MEFVVTDLRDRLLTELRQASAVDIAVAYFNPDAEVLARMVKILGRGATGMFPRL